MITGEVVSKLNEAAEICYPKQTRNAVDIMIRRLEEGGYEEQDCLAAIEECVGEGDIRFHKLIIRVKSRHFSRLRTIKTEKEREERRQEEEFLDYNESPLQCEKEPKDCPACPFLDSCAPMRRDMSAGIAAVFQGKCTAAKGKRIMAQRYPGVGFEEYGSAEYKAVFGNRCNRCGSACTVRHYDQIRCQDCNNYLKRKEVTT